MKITTEEKEESMSYPNHRLKSMENIIYTNQHYIWPHSKLNSPHRKPDHEMHTLSNFSKELYNSR